VSQHKIRWVACLMAALALGACAENEEEVEPVPEGAIVSPRADEDLAPGAEEREAGGAAAADTAVETDTAATATGGEGNVP
jgi:hypothetical protein